MTNVAIINRGMIVYSETFVQAHRNINANVFFYYGGNIPTELDGYGKLCKNRLTDKIYNKLLRLQKINPATYYLIKSLKKQKIDKILVEFGTTAAYIIDALIQTKIPFTVVFHGYDIFSNRIVESHLKDYHKIFEHSLNIVCVSKLMVKRAISLGCPESKIIYTPCAPNPDFYEIEPKFSEPKSFFALGRFVDKKAPYLTIMAFEKVVRKHPDAILYIGGDGLLYDVCVNLTEVLHLQKNIKFIGVISHDEFKKHLTQVAAFVQHSITESDGNSEGTPVTVLEASLAGLPVITTRHSGIADVIIDSETGFLVDEKDIDSMAEKMIEIIENPEKSAAMGKKGKKFIHENYNMGKHLSLIESSLEL